MRYCARTRCADSTRHAKKAKRRKCCRTAVMPETACRLHLLIGSSGRNRTRRRRQDRNRQQWQQPRPSPASRLRRGADGRWYGLRRRGHARTVLPSTAAPCGSLSQARRCCHTGSVLSQNTVVRQHRAANITSPTTYSCIQILLQINDKRT